MKMTYKSLACEIAIAPDFTFHSSVPCDLEPDTIRYAVRRFFCKSSRICRDCTLASWRLRLASPRRRRPERWNYILPAALLELPGAWARVTVSVTAVGVQVHRVTLLRQLPGLDAQGSQSA